MIINYERYEVIQPGIATNYEGEALQKMYNNMSSMSDLIVSKLKRK